MNFAIIGASGNVGRKTIEILEKSKISFKELFLVAQKLKLLFLLQAVKLQKNGLQKQRKKLS
jgi:aspartate-semialdehyde dehydrogenase